MAPPCRRATTRASGRATASRPRFASRPLSATSGAQPSAAIFAQELQAVGIKLDPVFLPSNPNFFGQALPTHDFDLAEFAWLGSPDPSGFDAIYQCQNNAQNLGGSNYKLYCNKTVDALIKKGESDLNPKTRTATYEKAAKIVAHEIAVVPLYAPPVDPRLQVDDQRDGPEQQPDAARSHVEHRAVALVGD